MVEKGRLRMTSLPYKHVFFCGTARQSRNWWPSNIVIKRIIVRPSRTATLFTYIHT